MWPTENALMSGKRAGTKTSLHPGPLYGNALSLVLTSSWPFDPRLWRLTVYFGPFSWVHCRCLPEWQKPETRRVNLITETIMIVTQFDPDFVFKWTHLPWALEMHLLRTECVNPETALHMCTIIIDVQAYLPAEWFPLFFFLNIINESKQIHVM